jgi:hypothetical protein
MSDQPYHNPAAPAERAAVHRNDERVRKGATYSQIAASESDLVGGRYATESRQRVVGAPAFRYPDLPSSSPWHNDPVPAEEPLGVDLGAAPVVGEVFEVEKSLAESQSGEGINLASPPSASSPCGDVQRSPGLLLPGSSDEVAPSPPSKRKRQR